MKVKGRNQNFFQMFFKMYAMQMECFTDFNTKIVKQCLVNTGVMLHRKKLELKRKILYN